MRLSSNMAAMLARKFILPQAKDGQLCPAPPQPGAGEFSQSPKSIRSRLFFALVMRSNLSCIISAFFLFAEMVDRKIVLIVLSILGSHVVSRLV